MLRRVQQEVLARLAEGSFTAPELEDAGLPSSVRSALRSLEKLGFAEITGTVAPVSPDGRGKRSNVWSITDKGRMMIT